MSSFVDIDKMKVIFKFRIFFKDSDICIEFMNSRTGKYPKNVDNKKLEGTIFHESTF